MLNKYLDISTISIADYVSSNAAGVVDAWRRGMQTAVEAEI